MNDKKVILIINRDQNLFLKPLDLFLRKNNQYIKHIYTTSFLIPKSKKLKYIIANIRIVRLKYILSYLLKIIKNRIKGISLKSIAKSYSIPITPIRNINADKFVSELSNHNARIVLSNSSQFYGAKILNITNLKFYNFHPGLLPQNKGRFPIFWAILNGNNQGITCHEIDEKIDHGPIVNQLEIAYNNTNKIEEAMENILEQMPDFMDESLQLILKNKTPYIKPKYKPFYGPIPNKNDIKTYHNLAK